MNNPLVCPFCGEQPTVRPCNPEISGNAWGDVACLNQNCFANPVVVDGEEVADDRGSEAYKQAAIKRWNTRTPQDQWISVDNEEWPDDGEHFICHTSYGVDVASYMDRHEGLLFWGYTLMPDEEVTHWMQPNLPSQGGE